MQTKHLLLKSGGRITAIHSVAHSTYRGVASWHFIGDVAWTAEENEGRAAELRNHEIPPYAVCANHDDAAAKAELDAIMAKLSDYLVEHGRWHEPKHMKDGRMVSWTPKKKEHRVAL